MSTRRITPVLLLIGLLWFIFLSIPQQVEAALGEVKIGVNTLNVRSGPGLEYELIEQVTGGERYAFLEEKDSWYRISLPAGKEGWVAAWLVERNTPQTSTKVIEAKVDRLNVRSGPDTSFQVVQQIRPEESFQVLKSEGDWSQIKLNEHATGWVANWLVELKEGEASQREAKSQEQTGVGKPTPDPQSATVQESTSKQVKVSVQTLNLRANPNLEADVIDQLTRDAILEVLAEQDDWLQIRYQGKQGWVANWLVNNLDASNATQNPTTQTQPKITILNNGTNLREGPGTNFPVAERANQGDTFEVVKTEGDWFQVALPSGKTAYIAGWIVAVEGANPVLRESLHTYLQGKKIVIDPGHGGKDDGATGSHFKTLEKVVNLQHALLLKHKLEAAGAKVVLTRDADYFITLEQRVNISISERADAFLSIHHNTNLNSNINGTITYYYSDEDRKLASYIQTQVVKNGRLNNLNARNGNYFVLRENPRPSVLLELGFLSNYHDELTIRTTKFQENAATGVLYGLAQYFQDKILR